MIRGARRPLVIYPRYFDLRYTRVQGRRLPAAEAVRNPTLDEIVHAARSHGLKPDTEKAPHPADRAVPESGRLRLAYGGTKGELLHLLGRTLKEQRQTG